MNRRESRTEAGWKAYAQGMENSVGEKARLLPFVSEGVIVEAGCGYGSLIKLLSNEYHGSKIIGVDNSRKMLEMAKSRNFGQNVKFLRSDISRPYVDAETADTVILCSVLHEVFSYSGIDAVRRALNVSYQALKKGGRLIIRDGVKPDNREVRMSIGVPGNVEKFIRFSEDFRPYRIRYKKISGDTFELPMADAMEFLSKYIYDINWKVEMQEQFGFLTADEWKSTLKEMGFGVLHTERYLIPFLRNRYESDKIRFRDAEKNQEIDYPDSTIIIASEKN